MRALRRRWPGWLYVFAAALLSGLCLILARLWLPAAVAAGATAAATVVAGVWAGRGAAVNQERDARRAVTRRFVRLNERGEPPLICELDDPLWVGVHPTAALDSAPVNRMPAFIRRDVTQRLYGSILRDRFVLLTGESTAGKTRAAYEAIRAVLPSHRFVEPMGREGLQTAIEIATAHPGCVLWLDDLERFLGHGGLTGASVRNVLAAPGSPRYIVASMRAEEHAKFGGGIGRRPEELPREALRLSREVLNLATTVTIRRSWSRTELGRAREHCDDPRIAEALKHTDRFGLAEYLAAGPQLLDNWRDGWAPGTHPRGAALVVGAVDARRAGIHRPLSVSMLEQLHKPYLRDRGGDLLRPESLDAALVWAATPLHATSSLLTPAGNGMFLAFDYLIDNIDREPVPAEALDTLIAYASTAEAMDVGEAAWRWDRLDQAEAAFRRAETGGQWDATANRYYVILERDGVPAALAFARRTLAERERALGRLNPDTLAARSLLMWEEGDAQRDADGNVPGAAEIATRHVELHEEASRALGKKARLTLQIRRGVAHWTLKAGRAEEAASLFSDLATDCASFLGEGDQLTFMCRWQLADIAGEGGDPAIAVRLLDQLIADTERIEGKGCDRSISARHGRAGWLAKAGRHVDAVREWELLVSDLSAARGDLSVDTLNVRREWANCVGKSGDPTTAAERLKQLVTDASQVMEPDGLMALAFNLSLALWTGKAGDPNGAVRQLEQLVEVNTKKRGNDDTYTKICRQRLTEWIGKASNTETATHQD